MDNFASRLRAQMSDDLQGKREVAFAAAQEWIENDILAKLELDLQDIAAQGLDTAVYKHVYVNGFYPQTAEIEELPSYMLLKGKAQQLGLDILAMSHKRLPSMDPAQYPSLEIRIKIPPAWKADYPHLNISPW